MKLSEKLKNRRKEMNLTQEEVANQIHVTRQTISNWETGRTLPDINSLILISNIYDISLDNLIKEDIKVIKKLDFDSKQAESWFVSSALLSSALSVLITTQSSKFEINILVLLLIIQTVIITYISISGYFFLKRNKEILRKNFNIDSNKRLVDGYDILYVVTIFCGIFTVILTTLMIN